MAKRFNTGVIAKSGKLRDIHTRPASKKTKEYQQVKYVWHGRALLYPVVHAWTVPSGRGAFLNC